MSASDRVDAFQQRHPWAGFPIAVIYKFSEDQGPYLAALITYYGFLALFPMLLLLTSTLGFVLQDDPELQRRILDSTLSQFPVIGDELGDPRGLQGSGVALVVGAVVALYGALGVAQAIQNAMNVAWAVPRHRRPNPIVSRVRSLIVIVIGGVAAIATTVMSALGSSAGAFGAELAGWTTAALMLAAIVVNAGIFLLAFRVTTAHPIGTCELLPGAVMAAVVWQLLQLFGSAYVGGIVKDSSATYGVFALVLGLLAWLFLGAFGVVFSAEINVVRSKQLYPRSLLTPFTDDVDLTEADREVYTDAATAQQAKGFQNVEVTFDHDGQQATALRNARRHPSDADGRPDADADDADDAEVSDGDRSG